MASFLVRLDERELDDLRQAAQERGRSMNDLAREGLRWVSTGAEREAQVRLLARRVIAEHAGLIERLDRA